MASMLAAAYTGHEDTHARIEVAAVIQMTLADIDPLAQVVVMVRPFPFCCCGGVPVIIIPLGRGLLTLPL